jgi:hypothetical protein
MTPLQFCGYAKGIYDDVPAGMFDRIFTDDGVVIGHAKMGDTDVLALRGSSNADDWMHDFSAIPEWHSQLGFCHAGFLAGMDDAFAAVRAVVGPHVAITGHSLGGARARILAALFAVNGVPVDTLCVFGSPKPAFINVARVIQKSGMAHSSYRFANDIVPTAPLTIEPWLDFEHTEPYTALAGHSAPGNLAPLRDHAIDNYFDALTLLAAKTLALAA